MGIDRIGPDKGDRELKAKVAEFWDHKPCGSFASNEWPGDRPFFQQVTQYRYSTQPFMHELIGFHRFVGQRLLEVGCGLGVDLREFALAGAQVVGMDMSARSVALARRHFRIFGTEGKFIQSDSEHLPFADESFDIVYSFGVLHHTPNTQAAIEECWRVLRPGGTFTVMLYNRRSWQALVEPYLFLAKRWLLRQPTPPRATDPVEVVRRTDGVENPLGKAYTKAEVCQMLDKFSNVKLRFCHPKVVTGSWLVRGYSRFLEWSGINRKWGFWIVAEVRRPMGHSTMVKACISNLGYLG